MWAPIPGPTWAGCLVRVEVCTESQTHIECLQRPRDVTEPGWLATELANPVSGSVTKTYGISAWRSFENPVLFFEDKIILRVRNTRPRGIKCCFVLSASDVNACEGDTYVAGDPPASPDGDLPFAQCFTVFRALSQLLQCGVSGHLHKPHFRGKKIEVRGICVTLRRGSHGRITFPQEARCLPPAPRTLACGKRGRLVSWGKIGCSSGWGEKRRKFNSVPKLNRCK